MLYLSVSFVINIIMFYYVKMELTTLNLYVCYLSVLHTYKTSHFLVVLEVRSVHTTT